MQGIMRDPDNRKDRLSLSGITGVVVTTTLLVSTYAPADVSFIDEFRYLRAVADARTWLLQRGVAPAHIAAGYAMNGWWLYAPAPQASSRRGREPDVPWVTTRRPLPYKIANTADPPIRHRPARAVAALVGRVG